MASQGGLGAGKRKEVPLTLLANTTLYHLFEVLEICHFMLWLLNQLLEIGKLRGWLPFQSISGPRFRL